MTPEAVTAARVREIFEGALRVSHAALARRLGMRRTHLATEGDLGRIAFALTPTRRRVYTEAAVIAWLARRDAPPPPVEKAPPRPPKRRSRAVADAGVIDFQAKLAARRAAGA